MADIAIGSNGVSVVFGNVAEIRDFIAVEAITAGQPVYITSAGKVGVADANGSGKQQFRGIALKTTAIGKACPVLKRGYLGGYVLTGVAYDGPVYLSDTAGSLGETAGTMSVLVGRCSNLADPDLTKILYVDADWLRAWA